MTVNNKNSCFREVSVYNWQYQSICTSNSSDIGSCRSSTAFAKQHLSPRAALLSNEPPAWLHRPRRTLGLRADVAAVQKTGGRGVRGSNSSNPHQTLLLLSLSYMRTTHHLTSVKLQITLPPHSFSIPLPPSTVTSDFGPPNSSQNLLPQKALRPLYNSHSKGDHIFFNWDSSFQSLLLFRSSYMNLLSSKYIFIYCWHSIWLQERKLVSHHWDCAQWLWKLSHLTLWLSTAFQHRHRAADKRQRRTTLCLLMISICHPAYGRATAQLQKRSSLFNTLQQ